MSKTYFSAQFSALFVELKKYMDQRMDLAKLSITEKVVVLSSFFITTLIVILLCSSALLLASFALSIYFNEMLHSSYLGFVVVTGLYFFLAFLVLLFKKAFITKPIMHMLLNLFFSSDIENPEALDENEE